MTGDPVEGKAPDPFDLERFVDAQESGGSYRTALSELEQGRKHSHWMWYVFPQLRGLGSSAMAQRYGISGLEEARAYLAHPVLGPRLGECLQAMIDLHEPGSPTPDAASVLGPVDAQKLRSCVTLFAVAADPGSEPQRSAETVLERYFGEEPDPATLDRLNI